MKNKVRNKLTLSMPGLVMAVVATLASMSLGASEPARTRLLVGIVVDGLDADYLQLLRERFGQGGFRRLESEGVFIPNVDYGTALDPGAATAMLVTGAAPSLSGIPASTYYDRDGLRVASVYEDSRELGNFTPATYSPRALRVSTLSDEARIASGGLNMVYSVAPDPAQALALAGHAGHAALWIDRRTGNWATSTFYREMPVSVSTRNRSNPLSSTLDTMSWTPSLQPAEYPALPDHLRRYPFRYVFPRSSSERLDMFLSSPLVNREVTTVAVDLLGNMRLGDHEDGTDVLNLAYTLQPFDYGKNPDSRPELMDAYLKLDKDLERLFTTIDRRVGAGNSVIWLAATPPSGRSRRDDLQFNIPYGEFSTGKAIALLNIYLIAVYGNGDYVSAYHNGHIFLNNSLLRERSLSPAAVRAEAALFLAKMTGIDRVYTIDEIIAGHAGERSEALRRNTTASTSGDLVIEVAPGFEIIDDYNSTPAATEHQTVQRSAMPVAPAFIMAPGLVPGTIGRTVDARSIAPTLSRILRIRSPNGATEAPLHLERR